MTLEKAIEILEALLQTSSRQKSPDSWAALKLGIEALKAWREMRREWRRPSSMLLPGETKT